MEKGDSARVKDHGKEPATRETGKWVVEREGCMTDWSEMTLLQVWGQSVESPGWSWAVGLCLRGRWMLFWCGPGIGAKWGWSELGRTERPVQISHSVHCMLVGEVGTEKCV